MKKNQITGAIILIASILSIIIYGWLLFFTASTPKPVEPKASTELEQFKEKGQERVLDSLTGSSL